MTISVAQLPNASFYDRDYINAADSNKWNLSLRSFGYTKNNEYFHPLFDGYTLFGVQVNPSLTYTLSDNFRFDAGLFVRQDFGADGFREVVPTFTFRAIYEGVDVIFGTLDGALNHGLIEPLFDFERVMLNRLEQGNQFRYKGDRLDLDLWIHWLKMIYPNDPDQEEVYGGLRVNEKLGSGFVFPLQFIIYHKGGSIDANPNRIKTAINLATGMSWSSMDERVPGRWEFSAYYLYYKDFNFDGRLVYEDGNGYYLNAMRSFGHGIDIMLSYWQGNEFIGLFGGKIYQSVSSKVKNPYALDPDLSMLILRVMQEIKLNDDVSISVRFEPMWDFGLKRFNFSHGLYFNFRNIYPLWRK